MANRETAFIEITPEVLLKAYACGIFPMADSADDPALYWIEPEMRGIIPLDRFHMPSRLVRTVRSDRFTVTMNRDFDAVLEGCSEPQPDRPRTWINTRIRVLYRKLYDRRHCHSLEVYEGDTLVGGLYGVTLGGAFFGESMFSAERDASIVLTARELEVLALLAEGASNKLIARRLGISAHTAKYHVASLLEKLDAVSRTDAVAHAARIGVLNL